MWIISLHVSSPGIWRMDQHDGMEEWSHRDMLLEKHCHGLWSIRPHTGGFPVSERHTLHGVWSVKNRGYKWSSSCTKNKDSLKAKVSTGGKYWFLLTLICVFRVCVVQAMLSLGLWSKGSYTEFSKKNKWMNECMNEYTSEWMNLLLGKAQYVIMVKTTHQGFLFWVFRSTFSGNS